MVTEAESGAKIEPCPYCGTHMVNSGAPIWEDYCPNKSCTGLRDEIAAHIRERRAERERQDRLHAAAPELVSALEAQERAENENANCPDCGGEGDWAECGRCSELFGDAINMRRAALSRAKGEE